MRGRPINLREGRPGETLVDVAAIGICGRDLHYYRAASARPSSMSSSFQALA
jgi:L-iditol 2-dehydrogenase